MFLTVCSLGAACLHLPADSSQDAVQGPVLTNAENRDSLIRFENVRDHLRQRETYTLELQEAVQLLNLDPTESRQLLRRDLGNFELVTQNTRSVFLDNKFGFFNSTKPERCTASGRGFILTKSGSSRTWFPPSSLWVQRSQPKRFSSSSVWAWMTL